jgi:hypothetical protein
MRLFTVSFGALALLAASGVASADVGFRIANNQLVTWLEDDALPPPINWVRPERVFDGDLDLVGGIVTSNDPGFHGEDGTLTGFHLGFNILAAARVWDVAHQNFNTISPLTLTMSAPLVGGVTTPPLDPTVPIPGPNVPVPPGEFDFHYDYGLNGSTPGIYLLELQITTDRPGIGASLPYWVSLNYGLPQSEHDASIEWVRQNLVPAPGSAAAGLAVLICGLARRRR